MQHLFVLALAVGQNLTNFPLGVGECSGIAPRALQKGMNELK